MPFGVNAAVSALIRHQTTFGLLEMAKTLFRVLRTGTSFEAQNLLRGRNFGVNCCPFFGPGWTAAR
ncbi:MAG: hypothetical protein WBV28_11555, partial [Terracidiphilus sp.]